MTGYDIKRLALILAIQAEIEGMKAQNKVRELEGNYPYFDYMDFEAKANEIRTLAYAPDGEF